MALQQFMGQIRTVQGIDGKDVRVASDIGPSIIWRALQDLKCVPRTGPESVILKEE